MFTLHFQQQEQTTQNKQQATSNQQTTTTTTHQHQHQHQHHHHHHQQQQQQQKEQIDFLERAAQFQVDLPAFFNAPVGITSAVQWALTIQEGVNCIHHWGCHQLLQDPLEKRWLVRNLPKFLLHCHHPCFSLRNCTDPSVCLGATHSQQEGTI